MVFSIPSFTTVGDQFDKPKKSVKDERSKSLADKAFNPYYSGKKGKLPDALFTRKFLSINEGDLFVDPLTRERRAKAGRKSTVKEDRPVWHTAGFPKKHSGSGDYYGTIGGVNPHETSYIVPRKGEAPPRKAIENRGFYTNPTKKGTFGFSNVTLSNIGQNYVADFFDAERKKNFELLQRGKKLMKADKPFLGISRCARTFDEFGGSGASAVYTMTRPMAPRKKKSEIKEDKKDQNPWRPAGNPPPVHAIEYREDPYDGFDPRIGKVKKVTKDDRATFRPAGATNSSWFTKSIAFAKL